MDEQRHDATFDLVQGMIVEQTGRHDCGGGTPEVGYAHEPGCGWEPVGPVEDLIAQASVIGAVETFRRVLVGAEPRFLPVTLGRALDALVAGMDGGSGEAAARSLDPDLDLCHHADIERCVSAATAAFAASTDVLRRCGGDKALADAAPKVEAATQLDPFGDES